MTKEILAKQRIEEHIGKHNNPAISCSFGKDSVVVLHLVKQLGCNIPVVFNNTKVERRETLQLKRQLVKDWDIDLIEVFPSANWTFWKIVEEYGFPVGGRNNLAAQRCCYYLKKKPMKEAQTKHQWDLLIDGLTAAESKQRYFTFRDYGYYRYNKKNKVYKLSPIWDWTPGMVWDYIEQNNLPYNKFYDKELPQYPEMTKRGLKQWGYYRCLRVGCWACTIPLHVSKTYLIHMRTFYPKQHQFLLKEGFIKKFKWF